MIELFYYMSPNVQKVLLFLEESRLDYRLTVVDVTKGEQYAESFAAVSPNSRVPAIVDHAPSIGTTPLSLFESGALRIRCRDCGRSSGCFGRSAASERSADNSFTSETTHRGRSTIRLLVSVTSIAGCLVSWILC